MSENLVWRVKRLVSGSVNGLVDAMETAAAESVMREAIREIERTVDDVRDELGKITATRYQTLRHIDKLKAKAAELADKSKFAVDQGRDDLAEAAISRQLDLEAQLPVLEQTLEDAAKQQSELEGYVAALNGRKREMEADLAAYANARMAAASVAGTDLPANKINKAERRVENAQSAFDRAMNGPSGVPGAVKPDRETVAKLHELEKVSRSAEVAARLAAVKAMKQAS